MYCLVPEKGKDGCCCKTLPGNPQPMKSQHSPKVQFQGKTISLHCLDLSEIRHTILPSINWTHGTVMHIEN